MTKKSTSVLLLLTFLFILSTSVSAVDTPSTPRSGLIKQWREERRETKEDLKATKAVNSVTMAQTRLDNQRKRLSLSQNGLYNSFTVRYESLIKYTALIQKKLDDKKNKFPNNAGIAAAQEKLNAISSLTATYTADLALYKKTIDSFNSSTDLKGITSTLKTQAKKINEDIKIIRQTLVEALRLIVKIR
jgi:hypothetical protein